MSIRYLDVDDLLHLHYMEVGPDVGLRDRNLLEAAVERPRQSAFGDDAQPPTAQGDVTHLPVEI